MSNASGMPSYWTRREVGASSTAFSTLSAARSRAALSKLQAQQAELASAAEAELARQQAALEAQELKDEAERHQLELELLEKQENVPARAARSHYKTPMLVPGETPDRLREAPRTDCPSERPGTASPLDRRCRRG